MNLISYSASFKQIKDLLKEFGLFKMAGIKIINTDGVSDEFRQASIKESYFKAYIAGLENYDYDFLLKDQSYFQFQFKESDGRIDLRYSFFQNPIEFINYEDYVVEQIAQSGLSETIDEIGMLLEDEYNQFLNEQELISNYTTVRCDVDYPNYKPLVHSVSHIHIGHNNNVRIPLDKIISPSKFTLFAIKQVYYKEWKTKVESGDKYMPELLQRCQTGEFKLGEDIFQQIERNDPYIT